MQRAEGSIIQYATLDMPGREEPVRALLNSVREDRPTAINRITLRKGRLPERAKPGEVVVDVELPFAAMMFKDKAREAIEKNVRRALEAAG